jgi:carotenoid cleavage dioxygenase-like enzyme
MIHAFTVRDGRVSYRNRWVRTDKWVAENAAGQSLVAGYGAPGVEGAEVPDTGVANTNILHHGGRLLALEEAHLPFELDPATLATRGVQNFGGAIEGRFTAHPKIDPVTGELVVPRAPGAAEGDGWLLAVAWRGAETRSDLLILDTDGIDKGPIATVRLGHRVPFGFHGNWVGNAA